LIIHPIKVVTSQPTLYFTPITQADQSYFHLDFTDSPSLPNTMADIFHFVPEFTDFVDKPNFTHMMVDQRPLILKQFMF